MEWIDAASVHAALPYTRLVPALRAMFAEGCNVPPRQVLHWDDGSGAQVTSLVMPAWTTDAAGGFYAVKVINIAPGNAARGLPGLHASVLLHDAATGQPLALLDGDAVTVRRTAAASALAASFLAREDASHLLVVGAGRIAAELPPAMRAVRPITRVSVWARRAEASRALVERWRADGFDAQAEPDLPRAVAAADIVSCATLATAPVVHGAWLAPGSHLDLIGSFTPQMIEADDDCFRGADLYVDTDEALRKSGDLLGPLARGVFAAKDVRGTLESLTRGSAPERSEAVRRTVFKSVGSALEDLCAARLVWLARRPTAA
jgi:ornithine cyclodeaminase/alanine dehydrogenase-like protein (mu-crystallin family)